jgi:hypothetical protein
VIRVGDRGELGSLFAFGFWLMTALSLLAAALVLGVLRRADAASVHTPVDVPPETSPGMVA